MWWHCGSLLLCPNSSRCILRQDVCLKANDKHLWKSTKKKMQKSFYLVPGATEWWLSSDKLILSHLKQTRHTRKTKWKTARWSRQVFKCSPILVQDSKTHDCQPKKPFFSIYIFYSLPFDCFFMFFFYWLLLWGNKTLSMFIKSFFWTGEIWCVSINH